MSRETWDALVVGGGPAGATAARALALGGARVLLLDRARFPRPKTCGSCIAPAALAALAEAGLETLPALAGAVPLRSTRLRSPGHTATLPLSGGVVLSRERLDAALLDEARAAGARVREGVHAVDPLRTAHSGTVEVRDGERRETLSARIVILATGLAGARTGARPAPNARLGAGFVGRFPAADLEPGVVDMVVGPGGYVGRVLLEDGRVDAACALDPDAVARGGGLGPAVAELLRATGRPGARELAAAPWRGTPLLSRRVDPAPRGALLVGDAAGYVEPFTGEGIAWALAGGAAVARTVTAAGDFGWSPELARAWRREYRRTVAARFGHARALAWLLRRPRLTAASVALAAFLPGAGAAWARRVQRTANPRHGRARPRALVREQARLRREPSA